MSDEKVVDLGAERLKRDDAAQMAAHERGEAFKFASYEFDDQIGEAELHNGVQGICVITDGHLSGLIMSRDDARKLGVALISAAAIFDSKETK